MLDDKGVDYRYRDYRKEPLSVTEIKRVLRLLGVPAAAVLRRRDKAFKELGLTGDEPDSVLAEAMSAHPTLLQRPIGVIRDRAVVGRPPERLLELVG